MLHALGGQAVLLGLAAAYAASGALLLPQMWHVRLLRAAKCRTGCGREIEHQSM